MPINCTANTSDTLVVKPEVVSSLPSGPTSPCMEDVVSTQSVISCGERLVYRWESLENKLSLTREYLLSIARIYGNAIMTHGPDIGSFACIRLSQSYPHQNWEKTVKYTLVRPPLNVLPSPTPTKCNLTGASTKSFFGPRSNSITAPASHFMSKTLGKSLSMALSTIPFPLSTLN